METKASHLVIGSFVLIIVAGIFGFVIWLAKLQIDRELAEYYIYFDGAVSGLSDGGDVLFNGIPVGSVQDIRIDPDTLDRVRVHVELDANTPVRADSVAVLQFKGITGVSQVLIESGTPGSALLKPTAGQRIPVIASKPSQFEQIFEGAPEVVASLLELLNRANDLLSRNNRESFSNILKDVNTLTAAIAGRTADLDELITNVLATTVNVRDAAGSVSVISSDLKALVKDANHTLALTRGAIANADQLLDKDVRNLFVEARRTSQAATRLTSEAGSLVAENRRPLNEFATDGLNDFTGLVREMRELVAALTRVTEKIDSDPARFLFGDSQKGFQAQ
ncbi:MAG: MlaD family protein [Proteobacteria bacterium]|nr:MlaD family protein [Pseudomonadota bacterium]